MTYSRGQDKLTEDWYVDYEKKILIRKYHRCGKYVFACLTNPDNEDLLKATISALLEYTESIPCSLSTYSYFKKALTKLQSKNLSEAEKAKVRNLLKKSSVLYHKFMILKTLRELYLIISSELNKDVAKLAKKYGLRFTKVETNTGSKWQLVNPHKIALLLNEIYELLGAIAYTAGLRFRFAEQKMAGFEKILEKEGFDEEELDIDKLLEG